MVLAEEHPDSINDGAFFSPPESGWFEQPATHHNGAAGFGFADAHAEIHQWKGSLAAIAARKIKYVPAISALGAKGDPDIHWVSHRTARATEMSY